MKVIIIGGGIAGLTTAVALQQQGINAKVYEAASVLKTVGAGIGIGKNAFQVFTKLGLHKTLKTNGVNIKETSITNKMAVPLQSSVSEVLAMVIHRAALHRVLENACLPNTIHLNKRLWQFEERENQVIAHFEDGTTAEGDILIGADGIHSSVRQIISPSVKKRYSGQTCWRGVCDFELSDTFKGKLIELWGGRGRFGVAQIDPKRIYWFAVESKTPENGKDHPASLHHHLTELFKDFHPEINQIIEKTPISAIHRGDLHDIQPVNTKWHKGRVCLIGDAAHATTPNMGQGAGQGIEDGYTLALCLKKYEGTEVTEAFKKFQSLRQKKVSMVVNNSWLIGKLAHWENGLATGVRDFLFKLTPPRIAEKQLESVLDISYLDKI